MSEQRPIPVRLSDEVIQQLDETATRLGTNRAALIRLCLTAFLEAFDRHGSVVLPLDWTEVAATMDGRRTRKAVGNPAPNPGPADVAKKQTASVAPAAKADPPAGGEKNGKSRKKKKKKKGK